MTTGFFIAMAGIALAVSIAGIGSAIGIGYAASASSGAMSEDAKGFANYLIVSLLPGTQGIYGFVIAYMWLDKLQTLCAGSAPALSVTQGLIVLFACIPVGLCGLSAIYQGKVCAAGINLMSKDATQFGKVLIFGALPEFYAILGFLISYFAMGLADAIFAIPAVAPAVGS